MCGRTQARPGVGAVNTISPRNCTLKNATGMATSGFPVEVKKADLGEMMEKYPEAFARPYQYGIGLKFDRILE